jgi:hypothetical protein
MFALAIAAIIIACGEPSKSEKAATTVQEEAWLPLLDSNSLKGWHIYNAPDSVSTAWVNSNGILHLDASRKNENGMIFGGGNLVTDEDYENFHLKLEWKISPGGNSGVLFYVKEDTIYKAPYHTGPEMQVLDNDGHPDGKIIKHRAGDLYDLISCSTETVKPVGEWNLAEIVVDKGKLDFYLNGVQVVSTTLWDEQWNAMIAQSKFKAWPDFAKFKSGKIVLQDHDNEVWFRNIMIKKL